MDTNPSLSLSIWVDIFISLIKVFVPPILVIPVQTQLFGIVKIENHSSEPAKFPTILLVTNQELQKSIL